MRGITVTVLAALTLLAGPGCSESAGPAPAPALTEPAPKVSSDKLALKVDPFCGMRLENAVADVYSYRGAQYGFCSDYCKDEFAKDPEKYLTKLSENKP